MTNPADLPEAPSTTTVDRDNPWPGPEAFREADAPYFFGRDRPRSELTRLVLQNRLVILYGRSGLGKTSLLRAGVFPLLRDAATLPIYVRLAFPATGETPTNDLRSQVKRAIERAVADANVDAPSLDPDATLWEWFFRSEARFFNERSRRVRPVLVFDQFEEAFTIGRTTPALAILSDQFVDELADLVRGSVPATVAERFAQDSSAALEFATDRDPCGVLLALRQEFLAELLRLRPRLPSLLDHRFELSGMTMTDAEQVVTKPGGHLVEAGVAARIVAFVAAAKRSSDDLTTDDTTVDPAILSIFCRELNSKRRALKMPRITPALVAGAQDAIIADFYTHGTRDLGPEIHRFIEERLVTDAGYRNSAALDDAVRLPGVSSAAIALLIERRLVRQEGVGPRARLELTHDVLTTPIVQSRNLRRLRELEEQAQRAAEQARTAQAKSQALRRLVVSLVVLSVGLILVGWLAVTAYTARTAVESTLSTAHVEQGLGLVGTGRRDRGYAYIAQALRVDPGNVAASSLALDAILHLNWPLPQAIARHDGQARLAQLDPTATRLATMSDDRTVDVWRVTDGQRLGRALDHPAAVSLARFGPDGRTLLTVAADGAVRLWDADTGQQRAQLDPPGAAAQWADFGPDGDLVVTAKADGTVRLWRGAVAATTIKAHADEIRAVTVDRRGERVATASADRTAAVWDAHTGRLIARLTGHRDAVVAVQFSPSDAQQVLTASRDGTARLWDLKSGKTVSTIRQVAAVDAAQFSPDGSRILMIYGDRFAALWSVAAAQSIGTPIAHEGRIVTAAFSPEGMRVLTASSDQTVRLWHGSDGSPLGEPIRLDAPAAAALFSPDGQHVATADLAGTSIVWDVRTGAAIPSSFRTECDYPVARYSPDGRALVIACNGELVFRTASGDDVISRQPLGSNTLSDLTFSRNGALMIVVTDSRATIFPSQGGSAVATLSDPELGIRSAELSADGRAALTTSPSGVVRTWEVAGGGPTARFPGTALEAHFTPDGSRVITSSESEGIARVWHRDGTPDGPPIQVAKGLPLSATINTGGTRMLTVSDRATLWNSQTGQPVAEIPQVRAAGFSPDGEVLQTIGNSTQLWDTKTGHLIASLAGPARFGTFSTNGQRLIGTDGTAFQLWDGHTGQPHSESHVLSFGATVVEPGPDGQRLLVVGGGKAFVWDVPTGSRADAGVIAAVLEAVVGYRINQRGAVERIPEPVEALREAAAIEATRGGFGDRIRSWALADRGSRTISPSSVVSIDQYVRKQIASPYAADKADAQRLFPWDARLRPAAKAAHNDSAAAR